MTKKIDEAVSLNVSTTQGEMTSTTTFTADDAAALAVMLKNAGIAGNSNSFNGPATLTMDVPSDCGGVMSSVIQAPDLRSIMQLLEPEFQDTAEPEMDPALAAAHADMDAMAADGHEVGVEIYDPGMSPYSEPAADDVDMGMDLEEPMDAPAEMPVDEEIVTENVDDDQFDALDSVTQSAALTQSEGVVDDCECGDDLMTLGWIRVPNATLEDEASHGQFFDYAERIEQMVNPPVGFTLDNYGIYTNEHDATQSGAEFVSIAFGFYANTGEVDEEADYDYRSHDQHPTEYPGKSSKTIVQPKTHAVPARSGDNPLGEASNPFNERTLDTYLRDGSVMVMYDYDGGDFDTGLDSPSTANHGDTITINSVVDENDQDITNTLTPAEHAMLEQECRDDLANDVHEDAPVGPKSFRDYVREASELNELSPATKNSYIDKSRVSKAHHEKKASDLEDLSHDADRASKMGIMRPGAGDRIRKWQRPHDHAAYKREKGLDRLGAMAETAESLLDEFRLNELSVDTVSRYIDRAGDRPEGKALAMKKKWGNKDFGFEEPKVKAKWGHEVDEETVNEISNDTKNSYFKKAADQINQHAQLAQDDRELGNHDNADAHGRVIQKRAQGMNRAIAREEEELDEAGRADWQSKIRQYGEPYYLNTDCGYSSLEAIMRGEGYFDDIPAGLAQHATKAGFTILEIERNGKKGYNFVTSPDTRLQAGTPVTCITQTSTGQKFRPGKFVASFTTKDLSTNYDMVVAQLARLGITPSKKLPVKTFD